MADIVSATTALRVVPLRIEMRATGLLRMPEYKGALFRGGFGKFLRDLFCIKPGRVCCECARSGECLYSAVFETPVPEPARVLSKYPYAPHPFVLIPPLDARERLAAGEVFVAELTLFGPASEWLPYFVHVFEQLGASGRFGGAFRLIGVNSGIDGLPIYDGGKRRFERPAPTWVPGPESNRWRRVVIDFVTPLRMRINGSYGRPPDFGDLMRALLRRVHLLTAVHAPGVDADWRRAIMPLVDTVETRRACFREFSWGRTSGRQKRWIEMDGWLGAIEAEGDLAPLAPYLRLGEWINLGSATSMGMGKYRASFEEVTWRLRKQQPD